ncbi:nuclear transport factor 2 family protein [Pseudoalteromonas rubra]|uniref:SnoaL-like domain-containing protein n=1 Tax=Pseudoalteromonas rubra TaxID=43658 RepID=A0A0U3H2S0_9GAMM|nr:nuclear transport factor 2 family protein [Pseudoalteromonas rubra]ALU45619.1 hypothetical protein AT705_22030 [Pseudoalteromonas rubra]
MYRRSLLILFLLGGCTTYEQPTHVKTCQDLVYSYPEVRDKGNEGQYAALFTDNARFTVEKLNISLGNKTEIVDRFNKARSNTRTVHMMTSSRQFRQNDTLAGESHFILLLKNNAQPTTTKIISGRYLDKFDYDTSQCRFSSRRVEIDRMDIL